MLKILFTICSILFTTSAFANPQWGGANSNTPPFNYIAVTTNGVSSFNVNSLNSLYTHIVWKNAISAAKSLSLKGCSATDKGALVSIKDGDANATSYPITITPTSGTIDNAGTAKVNTSGSSLQLICDGGSNWISTGAGVGINSLTANITSHTYYAAAYGNCTWNSTSDVTPCIQAAIDDASAKGGGTVVLPAGDFGLSTGLTLPITGLVSLEGAGLESGTILRALAGLTGGVMLSGGTDSGTNFIVRGTHIRKIKFACNDLAATAIFARSWQQFRIEDIFINSCTSKALDMGVGAVNVWGMAFGVIDNIIISLETAASANAHAITISQSTGTADDFHSITLSNIRTTAKNGDGLRCGQADAILVLRFMHTLVSGGTGAAARMLAHDTAASVCRKVHFVSSGFGSGAGAGQGLVLQGTETAANAVWNITSEMSIQGDGQPEPTVGTGVTGFICYKMGGAMCTGSQPLAAFLWRPPVSNKNSSPYTVTSADCGKAFNNRAGSGNQTFILPAASGTGCTIHINKWSAGSKVTVSADSAASIATPRNNTAPLATTGDTHSNTTLDNLASTANVRVGMVVSGTGIPSGTLVSAIGSATSITLSQAATATASGVAITFHSAVLTLDSWSKIVLQDQNTDQWVITESVGSWLTSAGGVASASGTTLIYTKTASASANLAFEDLPSAVNNFVLECSSLVPATDAVNARIQVGTGLTPTYQTANYSYTMVGQNTGGAASASSAGAAAAVLVNAGAINSNVIFPLNFTARIKDINSTASDKMILFQSAYEMDTGPVFESVSGAGTWTGGQDAVTAIRVAFSAGNITSGTCSLFALAE